MPSVWVRAELLAVGRRCCLLWNLSVLLHPVRLRWRSRWRSAVAAWDARALATRLDCRRAAVARAWETASRMVSSATSRSRFARL